MFTVSLLVLGFSLLALSLFLFRRAGQINAEQKKAKFRRKSLPRKSQSAFILKKRPKTPESFKVPGNLLFNPQFEIGEELGLDRQRTEPSTLASRPSELPDKYGDNEIVALVRDPYWVFAYWEINLSKQVELQQSFGPNIWQEARHLLRVFDTTDLLFNGINAHSYQDYYVDSTAASWHLPVGIPGRTYCIERGITLPQGQYLTLARSNFVTTPWDQISSVTDEEWMLVSSSHQQLYRYLGAWSFGGSSRPFTNEQKNSKDLNQWSDGR